MKWPEIAARDRGVTDTRGRHVVASRLEYRGSVIVTLDTNV